MKKRTNVSIDEYLLKAAKAHGLVLSQILESAIREELRKKEEENWLEENRDAITAYNHRVESEGVFSDNLRTF